ncbi:hypothetical protein NL676_023847 [Syzygium grande]|nr:hypothetical protein NL676_023847 [Syzygium grande]
MIGDGEGGKTKVRALSAFLTRKQSRTRGGLAAAKTAMTEQLRWRLTVPGGDGEGRRTDEEASRVPENDWFLRELQRIAFYRVIAEPVVAVNGGGVRRWPLVIGIRWILAPISGGRSFRNLGMWKCPYGRRVSHRRLTGHHPPPSVQVRIAVHTAGRHEPSSSPLLKRRCYYCSIPATI